MKPHFIGRSGLLAAITLAAIAAGCLASDGVGAEACLPDENGPWEASNANQTWTPVGFRAGVIPSDYIERREMAHTRYGYEVQFNVTPIGNPSGLWHLRMDGRFIERSSYADSVNVSYEPLDDTVCVHPEKGTDGEYRYDAENKTFAANVSVGPAKTFPVLLRLEFELGSVPQGFWKPFHAAILIEEVPDQTPSAINQSAWAASVTPSWKNNTTVPDCPEQEGGFFSEPYLMTVRQIQACGSDPRPLGYDHAIPERVWWGEGAPLNRM